MLCTAARRILNGARPEKSSEAQRATPGETAGGGAVPGGAVVGLMRVVLSALAGGEVTAEDLPHFAEPLGPLFRSARDDDSEHLPVKALYTA